MSKKKRKKLTEKEAQFAREYPIDFDGTKAAIRAGYSERTAHAIAYDVLRRPHVMDAIADEMQRRAERAQIDADYVLRRLIAIDQMDAADIIDDDGSVLPVKQWPKIWRQFIAGMDVSELYDGRGEGREAIGVLKKIRWPDKLKNLELLGKHIDVQAFREQSTNELTGKDGAPLVPVLNVNVSGRD